MDIWIIGYKMQENGMLFAFSEDARTHALVELPDRCELASSHRERQE